MMTILQNSNNLIILQSDEVIQKLILTYAFLLSIGDLVATSTTRAYVADVRAVHKGLTRAVYTTRLTQTLVGWSLAIIT